MKRCPFEHLTFTR